MKENTGLCNRALTHCREISAERPPISAIGFPRAWGWDTVIFQEKDSVWDILPCHGFKKSETK